MSTPKLTPEQDARLCAEYGVKRGQWIILTSSGAIPRPISPEASSIVGATDVPMWAASHESEDVERANAALMAASKEMVALLEGSLHWINEQMRREDAMCMADHDLEAELPLRSDIRALLDGLKGGE